ncbi:MAG: nuclear transport factor 2 family protein [Saprospiraceae bacterium]
MKQVFIICIVCISHFINAQFTAQDLIHFNQSIDNAVVKKDTSLLKQVYSDDFVFSHGTGLVEGRESWLNSILKPGNNYISRTHDSVTVEIHKPGIYILLGTLTVVKKESEYALNYERVFAILDKRLQMVSHKTFKEWHIR